MDRFAELSERKLSTMLEEKDAENTKKGTKVTLILSTKRINKSRAIDIKS